MAYTHINSKGEQYYLHMKDVELKGGRLQRIYFFAKQLKPEKGTPIDALPEGKVIAENSKTGLPVTKNDPALKAA